MPLSSYVCLWHLDARYKSLKLTWRPGKVSQCTNYYSNPMWNKVQENIFYENLKRETEKIIFQLSFQGNSQLSNVWMCVNLNFAGWENFHPRISFGIESLVKNVILYITEQFSFLLFKRKSFIYKWRKVEKFLENFVCFYNFHK